MAQAGPREGFLRDERISWSGSKRKISPALCFSRRPHYAAVARLPGRLGLKEIVTGPLAAQVNFFGIGYSTDVEFFSNETFNYGLITIDPKLSPPQMLLEILEENNRSLYKTRIDAV